MSRRPTDQLIELLSTNVEPVARLRPPLIRAGTALAIMALLSGFAFLVFQGSNPLESRGPRDQALIGMEMLAMLATGVLAVVAAFFLSIPGRPRSWAAAPLIPFAAWLMLSGVGCYRDLIRNGPTGLQAGHSMDCLAFIVGASLLLGTPLVWHLARAKAIDPLPVAAFGGLGTAALAAFLLQFFHPFAITFLDLGVHILAILFVVAVMSLLKRPMLRPA